MSFFVEIRILDYTFDFYLLASLGIVLILSCHFYLVWNDLTSWGEELHIKLEWVVVFWFVCFCILIFVVVVFFLVFTCVF